MNDTSWEAQGRIALLMTLMMILLFMIGDWPEDKPKPPEPQPFSVVVIEERPGNLAVRVALWGCVVLALYLFTGWVWTIFVGLGIMLLGLMFGHQSPQDDLVWRTLVADEVIEDDT